MPPVASSGSEPPAPEQEAGSRRRLHRPRPGAGVRSVGVAMAVALFVVAAGADYVVERGDTLKKIAAEHGTTVRAIAEANDLANPDLIRIGQHLVIPGQTAEGSSGGGTSYVVQRGDNLARIARAHGTTVSAIAAANNLTNVDLLVIGQQLLIPVAGAGGGDTSVQTYTVRRGDSLSAIAARFATTPEAIRQANGLLPGGTLYAGATLRLSGTTPVLTGGGGPASHTVQRGESLATIARRYGTSVSALVDANAIANPNLVRIGQVLTVPGGSAWVCPVQGARYINDWGFPRSGGRAHTGNDLFAPRGTPIRAPVAGVVEPVTGTIGGYQFRLRGDDGYVYIGTHMDAFGATGRVRAGDVIGTVGSTGNATGTAPHLHFEIHDRNGVFNPFPTLRSNGC
jgi:LysM repeat protein